MDTEGLSKPIKTWNWPTFRVKFNTDSAESSSNKNQQLVALNSFFSLVSLINSSQLYSNCYHELFFLTVVSLL